MATINKVRTSKQSYFFGEKAATDVLCFTKIIPRGSYLPQDVTYKVLPPVRKRRAQQPQAAPMPVAPGSGGGGSPGGAGGGGAPGGGGEHSMSLNFFVLSVPSFVS
ncbi:mediator of RNA polymerase II transcription subunit 14-like [Anopheles darlingi]|uniref:mediator of RNA polymerase II transcription subunit 14-like n=1 Tax=Anopheles darlingi TaxID=43151 RepID=UPI0021001D0B|nr:mediator of RNA polymerase II transcription subunit 14-like [Anopheles darlingi]